MARYLLERCLWHLWKELELPWMQGPELFLLWLRWTSVMLKVTLLCELCKAWPLEKNPGNWNGF